jgi:hypothetical protein
VLLEHVDRRSYRYEQVLASTGIWAVFYQGRPINLKTGNQLTQHPGPKYQKTSFANPGHAHNLARKLNQQFRTTDFTVVLLTEGTLQSPC